MPLSDLHYQVFPPRGAQQARVLRWIVGQGMLVATAGIAAGLAGGHVLSRLLATLLFGVQPRDPLTLPR